MTQHCIRKIDRIATYIALSGKSLRAKDLPKALADFGRG